MSHPLATLLQQADGLVLIGDSSDERFPAFSYNAYTVAGKRFYCLDMGGLTQSRGPTKGGKVYTTVAELPADRSDLAVIWVKPHASARAVELAHEAGCKRVWFSFGTGHRDGVARAASLGLEVVEIGRCPIYYLEGELPGSCRAHTALVKLTGTWKRPPQLQADEKRREIW